MLYIDENSQKPLYEQVYEYFVSGITCGEYRKGDKLPSTRSLARSLNLSVTTVTKAYDNLCMEGYAVSVPKSGYIVHNPPYKSERSARKRLAPQAETKIFNFDFSDFDSGSFPLSVWRRLSNKALLSADIEKIDYYGDKQGEYEFREEIAKHLRFSRGLSCNPEQIIISNSTSAILDTVATLMPDNRTSVAFEDPGFELNRRAFINNRFRVIPIPVEADGIDTEAVKKSAAGLVFTTPSHQMPMGAVLSYEKRVELTEWAEKNDSYIIENDYDYEFRYDIKPLPAMYSMNRSRVIYSGTFSKIVSPALRISYFVLPEPLLERYREMYNNYHCAIPWIQQKTITFYMQEGYMTRRMNSLQTINRKKRNTLICAVREILGDRVKISGESAGTHILLSVKQPGGDLVQQAIENNVKVYSLLPHWYDKIRHDPSQVIVGFNSIREKDIEEGVRRLEKAWFE